MPSIRPQRVAEEIRALFAEVLRREIRDPRLANVSVTEVQVTPDLSLATIHFSVFPGGEAERATAADAFDHAKGLFRRAIARTIRLRTIPDLRFRHDRRAEYAAHVDQVLGEVGALSPHPEEPPAAVTEEAGAVPLPGDPGTAATGRPPDPTGRGE